MYLNKKKNGSGPENVIYNCPVFPGKEHGERRREREKEWCVGL